MTRCESRIDDPGRCVVIARLLGRFELTVDGRRVDTESSKRTRSALAYLLLHRRTPIARDVLIETFWPSVEPDVGRNRLHVTLCAVRRVLRAATPAPVIERHFDTYRFAPGVDVWTDVDRFEQACTDASRAARLGDRTRAQRGWERACRLYDGALLPADPYLDWAAPLRETLRLRATEAHTHLMDGYAARAEYGAACFVAREVLRDDPCNEPVHRRLMTYYAATGDRHLALHQYRAVAGALREALDVEPAAETAALYEALRRPGWVG